MALVYSKDMESGRMEEYSMSPDAYTRMVMGDWGTSPVENLIKQHCVPTKNEIHWNHDPITVDSGRTYFDNEIAKLYSIHEEIKMYAYQVVIVNTEDNDYVYSSIVVASTKEQAKMLVFAEYIRNNDDDVTDETIKKWHFAVEQIGEGYSKTTS